MNNPQPARSVTMDLDLVLACDSLLDEELLDLLPVISLQLDDGAPLCIVDSGSIAAPSLLECSLNLLGVEIIREALDQSKAFSGVSLLESEMDKIMVCFLLGVVLGDLEVLSTGLLFADDKFFFT